MALPGPSCLCTSLPGSSAPTGPHALGFSQGVWVQGVRSPAATLHCLLPAFLPAFCLPGLSNFSLSPPPLPRRVLCPPPPVSSRCGRSPSHQPLDLTWSSCFLPSIWEAAGRPGGSGLSLLQSAGSYLLRDPGRTVWAAVNECRRFPGQRGGTGGKRPAGVQ